MNKLIFLFALSIILTQVHAASLSIEEAWQGISDPLIMSASFERKVQSLPLSGKAKGALKFWSGDYWALNKGNINYRWNDKKKYGFNLISPTKEQAQQMTMEEISRLSPSEKYDLFVGDYSYSLKKEVEKASDPQAADWEGICHGWAPAAMNHNEPTPKVMRNPDGINIPFGSSDIKALLSYFYANGFYANTSQMGRRCERRGGFLNNSNDCQEDMNAGAFHIVLTNKIGIEGMGFVADLERFREVWNHPIRSYKSKIVKDHIKPNRKAASGTVKMIEFETAISYINESENSWSPVLTTHLQNIEKREYRYTVEIDNSGNIIGGEWKSKDRPDFLWLKPKPAYFVGKLYRLGELLND